MESEMDDKTTQEIPGLDEIKGEYKAMSDLLDGQEIISDEGIVSIAKEELKPVRKWYKDQCLSLLFVIPVFVFIAIYDMEGLPRWLFIVAAIMSALYCSAYIFCSRYLSQLQSENLDMVSAVKKFGFIMKINKAMDIVRVVLFIPLFIWLFSVFELGVIGIIIMSIIILTLFLATFKESSLRYNHLNTILKSARRLK